MSELTLKEIGEHLAKLPEGTEVTVVYNAGDLCGAMFTKNVLDPDGVSPVGKRWARDVLAGISDAQRWKMFPYDAG